MPKIKNWSKQGDNWWRNDKTSATVRIMEGSRVKGGWVVRVDTGRGDAGIKKFRRGTKEQARKKAISYMEQNPMAGM